MAYTGCIKLMLQSKIIVSRIMAKRTGISASLRWQVFSRDGFRCRYCGSQAGEVGVTLHADHLRSVADGGTNELDILLTACQRCNGGKGAKSLSCAPGSPEAIRSATERSESIRAQADAIASHIEAREELRQEVINLLCEAYGAKSVRVSDQNISSFVTLIGRHGIGQVADWISCSAHYQIPVNRCIQYVYGIIRKIAREQEGAAS